MTSVLPNRTAIITGAAGALGRATALRLGKDGFSIAAFGRAGEGLTETLRQLVDAGIRAIAVTCDLHDADAIDREIRTVEAEFGPVTVLVNNAAIYPNTPFLEIPIAEYDDVVAVNQRAYFVAAQSAARLMVPRGHGSIINIGSITWGGGWASLASYVTTKGASVSMARALARELGPHNIRVNVVSPGAFPTDAEKIHDNPEIYTQFVLDHQSLKRRGANEELASVVSFLAGDDSSFVTGQTINVNGGWTMD
ncbi:SDR family NAD(P)-dependent oxidoreductase [Lacisediminihabitans profunda]|uniref:SDR family oxidoreductase n=1 Tax=Lacisediminihabitans profunda TaxID=2594790 RepID=A0A5C8UKC4_9MICO|nr:SDR family oxidoreductase [Lacisediminihabitans profunda]TXN28748.1 SDR family oxidoreductase [Lacisediminihabitans profunda]